ncbi:MAG TPA: potassium/proton antiporter, partial [Candidatus Eisenbacteria bacterium]|nr:potassium/proton antiporter [Candidatus Eisenbacteria bacterium]
LGQDVLGLPFDDAQLAQALGYAALVVILAEGGLTTSWPTIRPVVPVAAALATVGTAVSLLVTMLAAHLLLDVDWQEAALVGAVLAPTDSAAVFSVLRRVPLPRSLAGTLEAESGFNDAPAVILVVALAGAHAPTWWHLGLLLVYELAVGAAVGLAVGWLGAWGVRRIALPASGLYPLAVLALCVAAYGAAAVAHASGFLAVYLAAVVLGNARLPHRPATRGFAEGAAWLAQIGLFVMLGLLATPSELGSAILPALGVGLVLLLLARPASVLVSTLPFRVPWREQAFLSWAGLRGAVPIVLSTVPGDRDIFNLVFVLVAVFTVVQAPVLPWVASRLRIAMGTHAQALDIESSPLTRLDADLLHVTVHPGSRLSGVEIFELRLPTGAAITLVVRSGLAFVPTPRTPLQTGDELIVVATSSVRDEVERRLRAVSRSGRLAGWLHWGERPGERR